jgi:hypothetical protein
MSASESTARSLVSGRTSEQLVVTFAQTDVLLAETRAAFGDYLTDAQRCAAVAADLQICEVRGWILDELAARGDLALIDPGFEAFA